MPWTAEDYRVVGMKPPAELMVEVNRPQVPSKPLVKPKASGMVGLGTRYQQALVERLRQSGAE